MMNRLTKIFRIREWIASEIPILFILIYARVLQSSPEPWPVIMKGASWAVFTSLFLAFSYSVNDLSDMEVDRIAGKSNGMSNLNPAMRMLLLSGLILAGAMVMLPWWKLPGVIPLVIIMFFTGYAYSMPPLRFKESGILGLLFSGMGQRTLPLILGMALFEDFGIQNCLLTILFTAVGVRWIIVHQLIDFENDKRSGVITFATRFGYRRAEFIMERILFPLEITIIAVWFYLFSLSDLRGLLVLGIYIVWMGIQWTFDLQKPLVKWKIWGLLPLTHFYGIFWPYTLGVLAITVEPVYGYLMFFQLFLHGTYLKRKYTVGFTKKNSGQTIIK